MPDAAPPPVDRLDYRLGTTDAAALAALRPRWSARRWWLLPVAAAVVGTVWPMADAALGIPDDDPRAWLVAIALTLLVVVSGAAADRADRHARTARIDLPRGPVRLTLRPDGLMVSADGTETLTTWADIGAVDVTAGHVFVRTTPDTGIAVPRRAFADRRQMEAFAAHVDAMSVAAVD